MLASSREKTLKTFAKDVIVYPPPFRMHRDSPCREDITLKTGLMQLLKSWTPLDHVLCSWRGDKYIKGGKERGTL